MAEAVEDDFRDFVRARSPGLLGTAYLMTGDHGAAEDLLQATLVRAYRHWSRVREMDRPEAYVRRIMVNQRTAWWRRRRVIEHPVAALPDRPATGDLPAAVDERDALWRALAELPPRARAVLVLRYWEDLSEAETAELLGCAVGTVKSQASRGLRRLRGVLAPTTDPAPDNRTPLTASRGDSR